VGASINFDLEVHGQHIEYRPPPRAVLTTWPGPNLAPGAAVQWDEKFGAKPRQTFPGPWALFRLLDAAQERRESDVRSSYTFQMPGHSARIVVDAANVLNPFSTRSWQRFRCEF
jgi:type VI protein secretion system component VasK